MTPNHVKNTPFLSNESEIQDWLRRHQVKNFLINPDCSVDVTGSVQLKPSMSTPELKTIPVNFREVTGNFDCSNNCLESLEGCPQVVGGNFNCALNVLTDLQHCPKKVGGILNCSSNYIESLQSLGYKTSIQTLHCDNNELKDLKGAPFELKKLVCDFNHIKSLEDLSDQIEALHCSDNQIEKFPQFSKNLKSLTASNNQLTSLQGLPNELDTLCIDGNPLLRNLKGSPRIILTAFSCRNNALESFEGAPDVIHGDCFLQHTELSGLNELKSDIKGAVYFTGTKNGELQDYVHAGEFGLIRGTELLALIEKSKMKKAIEDHSDCVQLNPKNISKTHKI